MATFNTNSRPEPIYPSTWDTSANPIPDVGAQFFLGCTVIDFSVSADWSSQGGTLTANILEDQQTNSMLNYDDGYGVWSIGNTFTQKLQDRKIYDWATGTFGSLPVIGSPQHFRVLDSSGNIVFQYDGILESITRNASPDSGKVYSVTLQSPLSLLENCSIILAEVPGFGHAKEGSPSGMSLNGFYKFTSSSEPTNYSPLYFNTTTNSYTSYSLSQDLNSDFVTPGYNRYINEIANESGPTQDFIVDKTVEEAGTTFGTHNRSLNWNDIYNIQNVFGIFENDSYGISGYSRYGGSRNAGGGLRNQGMRLDMIAFALDELINRAAAGTTKKTFGGNIISGTTTYNTARVASDPNVTATPYFYGFDVYSFTNTMMTKLGSDYIYPGDISSNLLEFVSSLCDAAGVDFIIELNRIQTSNASAPNYWNSSTNIVSNYDCPGSLYHGGSFYLAKSFNYTTPGGILSVKVLDRRSLSLSDPQNTRTPFSKIAYQILGYEVPDYGDKNIGRVNPGDPNPFSTAFEVGAFGNTYLDPLDDDYYLKGTDGSTPYGGKFPVSTKFDQNLSADTAGLDIYNLRKNAKQTTVTIKNNQSTTAKFVVGGKQSRLVHIPREYIYQYWGEVKVQLDPDCPGAFDQLVTKERSMPVITPILESYDMTDFIVVDVRHIYAKADLTVAETLAYENASIAPNGLYLTSVCEIRAAMKSKQLWQSYLKKFKPCIYRAILKAAGVDTEESKKMLMDSYIKVNETGVPGGTAFVVDVMNAANYTAGLISSFFGNSSPVKPSKQPPQKEVNLAGILKDNKKKGAKDAETLLYEAIKDVGDKHYGKSWVAWTPQATAKLTEDSQNNGEYIHSWTPSEDCYLEPGLFSDFSAPTHNKFMNGARVRSYANYPGGLSSGTAIIERQRNLQPDSVDTSGADTTHATTEYLNIPVQTGGDKATLNFTSVDKSSMVESKLCDTTKTSIRIDVDDEFTFVPYDYFYWYDRGRRPIMSLSEEGSGTSLNSVNYLDGATSGDSGSLFRVQYAGMVADPGYSIYAGTSKSSQDASISGMKNYAKMPCSINYKKTPIERSHPYFNDTLNNLMCSDNTNLNFSNSHGISNLRLANDFIGLKCPDHGVNCITFTKFTTPFIGYPKQDAGDPNVAWSLNNIFTAFKENAGISGVPATGDNKVPLNGITNDVNQFFKPCFPPLEVGIGQQSTRHHYGPWFTSHNFSYGGKVEFIQDDSLVPENFIFPNYGSLSSSDSNSPVFSDQLSGFVGMNYAGQSIANSIDGYSRFAAEDGSLTIPGAPLIKRIGDALLDGPYITEINVSVGNNGIETSYSFNSVTKKAGRTNTDIIDKLKRISGKMTKNLK